MKKNLSIYLVLLLSAFVAVSCGSSDEEQYELSPFAYIRTFGIGNIKSAYPSFTSDGKDTTVVKTVSFANVAFTIDQVTGEIYNNDSLTYATDVSKVVINMSADGVPSIYNDSTGTYDNIYASDSIDFTLPRKFRVYSADASYYKDYTISINVHQVEPEKMVWDRFPAVEGVTPVRALESDGKMYLFGKNAAGDAVVAVSAVDDVAWDVTAASTLPVEAMATINIFKGKFYAVANGDVYSSSDSRQWDVVKAGTGAVAIVGASDDDGKLWISGEQGVLCSVDGVSFDAVGALPEGFPLYGVSVMSYPLCHNKGIIRYMLVGYTTSTMDGGVSVWSKLSNEENWVCYDDANNAFACPALRNVAVVRYDNFLYALGGAGIVGGNKVSAFSSFYISRDNGIVWKKNSGFYQLLPEELMGNDAAFAVAVDSRNYMWIINDGVNGGVWKGIINRLGFKK